MITSTIEKTIRAEYVAGKTQADLAAMMGATNAYINMLLSGRRAFGGRWHYFDFFRFFKMREFMS